MAHFQSVRVQKDEVNQDLVNKTRKHFAIASKFQQNLTKIKKIYQNEQPVKRDPSPKNVTSVQGQVMDPPTKLEVDRAFGKRFSFNKASQDLS